MAKKKKQVNEDIEKTYSIDFSSLKNGGYSVELILSERLKSAGIKLNSNDKLDQLIVKCSKFKKNPHDFIFPELSLSESIFRALLIRKNSKSAMHQIQSDLSAVWLDHYKLPYKNLSDNVIMRILESNRLFKSA